MTHVLSELWTGHDLCECYLLHRALAPPKQHALFHSDDQKLQAHYLYRLPAAPGSPSRPGKPIEPGSPVGPWKPSAPGLPGGPLAPGRPGRPESPDRPFSHGDTARHRERVSPQPTLVKLHKLGILHAIILRTTVETGEGHILYSTGPNSHPGKRTGVLQRF